MRARKEDHFSCPARCVQRLTYDVIDPLYTLKIRKIDPGRNMLATK